MKMMRGCHVSNIAGMSHRVGKYGPPPAGHVSKDRTSSLPDVPGVEWREDASNADVAFLEQGPRRARPRCCAS